MKLFLPIILVFLTTQCLAQRADISVSNGSGDGHYKGEGFVHVWADPNPAGMVFDRWTGNEYLVQRPTEWHSNVRTAALNISLTATYKPAPVWTPTLEQLNGIQMGYHFPQNASAVIFHFHGQGGSGSLLFNNLERRIFANEAVAEGYAIVAIDSADRVNRDWSTSNDAATNPDIQNVQAAIDLFIQRGWMSASTPVFAHGFSKGAGFSPRVARALIFKATSMTGLAGTPDIINITTIPTIWCMPVNDGTIMAAGLQQSYNNYLNLIGRGVPAQHHKFWPSPVYPERFRRIAGLSQNDSLAIHAALRQNGVLDGRDNLIQDPDVSGWQSTIPPQYSSFLQSIGEQLRICYAEHNFFSDYDRRVLDFFAAYR